MSDVPVPAEVALKLEAAFERFAAEAVRTAHQAGPDEVHDVRVSIRRLEQALEIFCEWLPEKRVDKIRRRLNRTLDMAGEVRDRDIAVELANQLELEMSADARAELAADRVSAAVWFRDALARLTAAKKPAVWAERLSLNDRDGRVVLGPLAVSLLPGLAAEFIARGAELAEHPKSRRALHRFRITAKRFRYSLEFLANLYDPEIDDRIGTVRKVQTALGDLQDCVATMRLLARLGVPHSALKPLRHEERKRLEKFRELWPTLFGQGAAGEWTAYLQRVRRRRRPG